MATLAEKAGLHPNTIQRTERATHAATLDVVGQIARGLGVPVAELFPEDEPSRAARMRLREGLDRLPDDALPALLAIVDALRRR